MTQFPSAGPTSPAAPPVKTTSGMALASMILGIIGFITGCLGIGVLLGVTALVLGIVALTQIGKPGNPPGGKSLAITGTVLGGLTVVLSVVMIPMMIGITVPALSAA